MAEDQTPFKATQTFTHKYANEMVLRTYLMGTAGLKETQFRINVSSILPVDRSLQILSYSQIQDNKIEIQLTGESAKLEEVSLVQFSWL